MCYIRFRSSRFSGNDPGIDNRRHLRVGGLCDFSLFCFVWFEVVLRRRAIESVASRLLCGCFACASAGRKRWRCRYVFFFPKARVMLKAVIGHVAFVFCSPRLPSQQRQQEGESNFEPTPHFDFYFALLSFHLSNSSAFSFSYSAHSFVISASCLLFCRVIFVFFFFLLLNGFLGVRRKCYSPPYRMLASYLLP